MSTVRSFSSLARQIPSPFHASIPSLTTPSLSPSLVLPTDCAHQLQSQCISQQPSTHFADQTATNHWARCWSQTSELTSSQLHVQTLHPGGCSMAPVWLVHSWTLCTLDTLLMVTCHFELTPQIIGHRHSQHNTTSSTMLNITKNWMMVGLSTKQWTSLSPTQRLQWRRPMVCGYFWFRTSHTNQSTIVCNLPRDIYALARHTQQIDLPLLTQCFLYSFHHPQSPIPASHIPEDQLLPPPSKVHVHTSVRTVFYVPSAAMDLP
jgi:hypothetical protein